MYVHVKKHHSMNKYRVRQSLNIVSIEKNRKNIHNSKNKYFLFLTQDSLYFTFDKYILTTTSGLKNISKMNYKKTQMKSAKRNCFSNVFLF